MRPLRVLRPSSHLNSAVSVQRDRLARLRGFLGGEPHLNRPKPILQSDLDPALPANDMCETVMLVKGRSIVIAGGQQGGIDGHLDQMRALG
ncbi:MAG: hypothetical protein RLZZ491_2149, partial [Pseudomonadota bacterium]